MVYNDVLSYICSILGSQHVKSKNSCAASRRLARFCIVHIAAHRRLRGSDGYRAFFEPFSVLYCAHTARHPQVHSHFRPQSGASHSLSKAAHDQSVTSSLHKYRLRRCVEKGERKKQGGVYRKGEATDVNQGAVSRSLGQRSLEL